MADKKPALHTAADTKNKHEIHDGNILERTAHSIRDKVHELTDEVKEKAHHLKHGDDSKKSHPHDKPSSHPPKIEKKNSGSSSADEKDKSTDHPLSSTDEHKDTAAPPSSGDNKDAGALPSSGDNKDAGALPSSGDNKDAGALPSLGDNKDAAALPSSGDNKDTGALPSSGGNKDTGALPSSGNNKDTAAPPSSGDNKDAAAPSSSGDNKDAAAAPSSSGLPSGDSKPSTEKQGDNATAPPTDKPGEATKDNKTTTAPPPSKPPGEGENQEGKSSDASKNPPPVENPNDRIHISFEGVNTVDDLLERIDDSVEKAKIVVDDGKKKAEEGTPSASTANNSQKKPEDEPIRISYDKVHKLEDLIALVNDQPGHRKVVLEGAPAQSNTVSFQKTTTPSSNTKKQLETPSTQTDQIHVNIENIQSVDELLDRIDDAVQHVPVSIDITPQQKDTSAPSASAQNKTEKDVEASLKFQKEIPETTEDSNEKLDRF